MIPKFATERTKFPSITVEILQLKTRKIKSQNKLKSRKKKHPKRNLSSPQPENQSWYKKETTKFALSTQNPTREPPKKAARSSKIRRPTIITTKQKKIHKKKKTMKKKRKKKQIINPKEEKRKRRIITS